jgi:hypothetical protein
MHLCTCVSEEGGCRVGLRDPMHLCTCVSEDSEEGGDREGADSEAQSLLPYTLRYVSLAELGTLCRVGLRDPMHLCTCVSEERRVGTGRVCLLSVVFLFYFIFIRIKIRRNPKVKLVTLLLCEVKKLTCLL